MKDVSLAKKYAKALAQLGREQGSADDVLQGLSNMNLAMETEPKLASLLASPLVSIERKESLVKAVSSNKLFTRLAYNLIRRHRVGLLPVIFRELQALLDTSNGLHRALIKTASPLSDTQKKDVEAVLAKRLGGNVMGRFEVAVDLIGGVWMQTGDKVLDATIRGKIDSFRRTLVHSAN